MFDVADTIGMLDERPLITINMMYDPGVDELGLELLAVQALLDIERDGIDKFVYRDPVWAACAGGLGLTGSMWRRCASGCRRRCCSHARYSASFMGGMGFQLGSLMILRASFMPRRSAGIPVLKHLSTAARRMNSLQKVAALPRRNNMGW